MQRTKYLLCIASTFVLFALIQDKDGEIFENEMIFFNFSYMHTTLSFIYLLRISYLVSSFDFTHKCKGLQKNDRLFATHFFTNKPDLIRLDFRLQYWSDVNFYASSISRNIRKLYFWFAEDRKLRVPFWNENVVVFLNKKKSTL